MSLVAVRPADLDADAGGIIKLLSGNLNPAYDHARFEWLYRRNPDGIARAWALVDTGTDDLVGTAAAIPRRMFVAGREELAWILSDFCVAEPYRALGPALQLQRACLAPVTAGEIGFCYDFPSAGMMAVYRRLRIAPLGQLRRFVRPLRVDAHVHQMIGSRVLACGLSAIGNLLLARAAGGGGGPRDLQLSLHRGDCGAEFSALAREVGRGGGVCVLRSAEYLNWRFRDNPFQHHEILTAHRHGSLLGYAVIAVGSGASAIVDLCGLPDPGIIRALANGASALLRARGASTASVSLLDSHPWVTLVTRLGFRPRDACPAVSYVPTSSVSRVRDLTPAAWLLTQGDRDS